ncbi:hypothetical protein [uncultured Corynebacterium sp.]|uniref:hypothetical protein n=1 Tax=uncultured Corynebacterium sp. TaxID=159447 RepID=UPI0025D02748|nr:hypothetical protein [uncultured Corynebacterium sp.]
MGPFEILLIIATFIPTIAILGAVIFLGVKLSRGVKALEQLNAREARHDAELHHGSSESMQQQSTEPANNRSTELENGHTDR